MREREGGREHERRGGERVPPSQVSRTTPQPQQSELPLETNPLASGPITLLAACHNVVGGLGGIQVEREKESATRRRSLEGGGGGLGEMRGPPSQAFAPTMHPQQWPGLATEVAGHNTSVHALASHTAPAAAHHIPAHLIIGQGQPLHGLMHPGAGMPNLHVHRLFAEPAQPHPYAVLHPISL